MNIVETDLIARALRQRISLAEFVKEMWPVLGVGGPLIWSWHMQAACDHLEALFTGWVDAVKTGGRPPAQNLAVAIPPGSSKSRITSVALPAWAWIRHPEWSPLYVSAAADLASRDSRYCRQIIESDWYRESFFIEWRLRSDQNSVMDFSNTAGGSRKAMGIKASVIGWRADSLIIDDPIDVRNVYSPTILDETNATYDTALANRLNDLTRSLRILIMQRLGDNDPYAHVTQGEEHWEQLVIPQEYHKRNARPPTWIGWVDPRTEDGELMCEERFPASVLRGEKIRLGAQQYAAQHQQDPVPVGGLVFKEDWLGHYWVEPPTGLDMVFLSVDCAFKHESDSDFVPIETWGVRGAERYLLDEDCAQRDIIETIEAVKRVHFASRLRWGHVSGVLIEDKANGPACMRILRESLPGIIPFEPGTDSKIARARSVTPFFQAGNVWLPSPQRHEWVTAYKTELLRFPKGRNDDRVDATSQALIYAAANFDVPMSTAHMKMPARAHLRGL